MLSARVLAIDRRASAPARASAAALQRARPRRARRPRRGVATSRARVLAPRVDVRGAPYRDATTNRRIGSRARDRSRARDVDRDGVDRARGVDRRASIARAAIRSRSRSRDLWMCGFTGRARAHLTRFER